MALEAIDALYEEGAALSRYLAASGEPSFQVYFDNQFRKALLLAAASRFETDIKDAVLDFATERAGGSEPLVSLIKAKAIERQYHTFFQWDGSSANHFFALFGPTVKDKAKSAIGSDQVLADSVKAFLELGHLRNQLVHLDFASFPLEKTAQEIYDLYCRANVFVAKVPSLLREED